MSKIALITGITGQDGSYMTEFLLEKGYRVYGLIRRSSHEPTDRIQHLLSKIEILDGDLTDQSSLGAAVQTVNPDEIYNFAAQSFVPTSWNQPVLTADVTGLGVVRLLEAIHKYKSDAKLYQASSSEMFGKVKETPQKETTPFYPRSPYGVAKVYAHYITVNYRESYNLFACSGIAFNHESPRRGLEFVSRKVTHTAAKIKLGHTKELPLGNLEAKRDWGFAGDYVEAMWLMLQQDKPEDFIIATGQAHTVKELVQIAFDEVGLPWEKYVRVDKKLFRPAEVDHLIGDAAKAKQNLGWQPKLSFEEMIRLMVHEDIKSLSKTAAAAPFTEFRIR
ncbi:MAG: GDP-mannose 4,6-dehydratase [Elusimicrobia bacterium]|nr:GDP-mannose 4,6-dehydratase [Elusimicrobiota bacterium]